MAHPFSPKFRSGTPLLYALLDIGLVGEERAIAVGREILAAGADLLQLRGKELPADALLRLTDELVPLCRQRGIPLIVNDRVDVALSGGADGVHLGAEDLPPAAAREILGPDAILGGTVHGSDEIQAFGQEVDYLGVGAIFPTRTRSGAVARGAAALTAARAATTLPIFAIGGITPENVLELRAYGLAGVAVAGALLSGGSVRASVTAFREAFERW